MSAVKPPPLRSSVAPTSTAGGRLALLLSRNSLANFVYLAYATLIVLIDFWSQPLASAAFRTGDYNATTQTGDGTDDYNYVQTSDPYTRAVGDTNTLFVIAGAVHLFNACQYFGVWPALGYSFLHVYQVPEALNVLGAALYLYTATTYNKMAITGPGRYLDAVTLQSHGVETAAAAIELLAAGGWCAVWWHSHQRGPGRGLTLDDPEFCALVCLVAPSVLYVAYNAVVVRDPTAYYASALASDLFSSGDCIYFAGAVFYALVSFRDAGYFDSFGLYRRCCCCCGRAAGGGKGADVHETENAAAGAGLWLSASSAGGAAAGAAAAVAHKHWERREEGGDVWWVNSWTGESQWEKPAGVP